VKIYLQAPNENWILDRIKQEWYMLKSDFSTNNVHESDLIWLISAWQWNSIPAKALREKKVIATIHHVVPDKFTKQSLREFLMRDEFVDEYHTPCQKTKDFISKITKKPINVIGYWYNSDIWYPVDKLEARKVFNIPEDAFVVGSFQRDTEGSDLASPKLEKGPDLFVDYLKKIENDKLLVLLGGWRRQYVINRLKEENINFIYNELAPFDQLRQMYGSCDLYVVASRYEGGPQAILEASEMKIPVISRDVGMASAVLNENCILDIPNEIYYPTDEDVDICHTNVKEFELRNIIEEYQNMFFRIMEAK
jgi:glycosyltransferase involved in cell wall biosynthesis